MKGVASIATLMLAGTLAQGQVGFELLGTVNVDSTADPNLPQFIGNNPSAVAWDGSNLYLAGFNQSGVDADTSIVKITDALGAQTFGSAFGSLLTPNSRGFSGLDISSGILSAAWDDGDVDDNGIRAFDASDGSMLWAQSARGGSGVAFDPGFAGVDSGVAWTTFGSGRRALNDTESGAPIYTLADGMVILTDQGTFWRDMDFAPDGDIYLREGDNLIAWNRTGGNSVDSPQVLFDQDPDADFVNGQNVGYLASDFGDFVIFNTRVDTGLGQSFADVLLLHDVAKGTTSMITELEGLAETGNGYYDFDYDAATGTLAIMDFANRDVAIYQLVPAPATLALPALMGAMGLRRRR